MVWRHTKMFKLGLVRNKGFEDTLKWWTGTKYWFCWLQIICCCSKDWRTLCLLTVQATEHGGSGCEQSGSQTPGLAPHHLHVATWWSIPSSGKYVWSSSGWNSAWERIWVRYVWHSYLSCKIINRLFFSRVIYRPEES